MLDARAMDVLDTRRPRLLLLAFCLLVWLPGLFTLPPTDRDESRFAQASKQMIESGDYVRIMNGDEPRNRKPIGIYWLQVPFVGAAEALGLAVKNPIWPYRLPSLLGGLVAVLATYEIGLGFGDRRAGLLAGGMLAACVVLVGETHIAKTDAALLGATMVAMAVLVRAALAQSVSRGQAAVFWLAMGVGILLKGPITPMVAGLAALSLSVVRRQWRWLGVLRPGWGVPLMLLVVLPWFAAIGIATHGAFFRDAVGGDLANKLASGDDAHGAPPGFHLLLLPLLAFPATVPVLAGLPRWWRQRRDPIVSVLLCWVVPSWIVFEAVPTKLPHYTLPLYPAVFLLSARLWPGWAAIGRGWRRVSAAVGLVVAVLLAVAALALPVVLHVSLALAAPAVLAAGLLGWLVVQRPPSLALAAMPLFTLGLLGWELPHLAPLWIAPQVERALVASGMAGERLTTVGFHEPSLMFLAGTATIMAPDAAAGADELANGEAGVALVDARDAGAFAAEAARDGCDTRTLGTVNGFNYSRGRAMRLTLYGRAVKRDAAAVP